MSASVTQYKNRFLNLEGGKSCETIPEDNELKMTTDENCSNLTTDDGIYDDLLSIDRVRFFVFFSVFVF